MTKEEIKTMLKDSAFWICPDDNELVSINIDRTADKIFKNLPQADIMLSLPSDKEADEAAIRFGTVEDSNGKQIEDGGITYGFIEAYNWMKREIKNRNKRGNGA